MWGVSKLQIQTNPNSLLSILNHGDHGAFENKSYPSKETMGRWPRRNPWWS